MEALPRLAGHLGKILGVEVVGYSLVDEGLGEAGKGRAHLVESRGLLGWPFVSAVGLSFARDHRGPIPVVRRIGKEVRVFSTEKGR